MNEQNLNRLRGDGMSHTGTSITTFSTGASLTEKECVYLKPEKSMADKKETGKTGEAAACSYLKINGYTILHTNWRHRRYELDIVATNGEELVVIEVKTRSALYLVYPEESVNRTKIKHIVSATDVYVRRYDIDQPVRFDIICMIRQDNSYVIERHIEDAFYAPMR